MRKDVKAGLALSLVVVVLAGWYYMGGESPESVIPLEEQPAVVADAQPQPTPTVAPTQERPRASRQRPLARQTKPQRRQSDPPPVITGPAAERQVADRASRGRKPRIESTGRTAAQLRADREPEGEVGPPAPELSSKEKEEREREAAQASRTDRQEPIPAHRQTSERNEVKPKPRRTEPITRPTPRVQESEPAVETYTVQDGDTLAILSEIFYGSQRYADFLMTSNPQITDPRSMKPGMQIRIPELPADVRNADNAASVRVDTPQAIADTESYVVREGDSFYLIARRKLGAGSRWPEIYELNKDLVGGDPKGLRAGQTIRIPLKK